MNYTKALSPLLKKEFPDVLLSDSDNPFATFKSPNNEITISILDDGNEITVFTGNDPSHFHLSIDNYLENTEEEKLARLSDELFSYLRKIFNNEYEYFSGTFLFFFNFSGIKPKSQKYNGCFSKLMRIKINKTWTWT